MTKTRLIIGLAFLLELLALAYVGVMAWMISVWFLDDAEVVDMVTSDWWVIAGQRFAVCVVVSALLGSLVFGLNRWLLRRLDQPSRRLPLATGFVFFALPAIASMAGAIQFGVTKPYM